jgi:hypothetical protein
MEGCGRSICSVCFQRRPPKNMACMGGHRARPPWVAAAGARLGAADALGARALTKEAPRLAPSRPAAGGDAARRAHSRWRRARADPRVSPSAARAPRHTHTAPALARHATHTTSPHHLPPSFARDDGGLICAQPTTSPRMGTRTRPAPGLWRLLALLLALGLLSARQVGRGGRYCAGARGQAAPARRAGAPWGRGGAWKDAWQRAPGGGRARGGAARRSAGRAPRGCGRRRSQLSRPLIRAAWAPRGVRARP